MKSDKLSAFLKKYGVGGILENPNSDTPNVNLRLPSPVNRTPGPIGMDSFIVNTPNHEFIGGVSPMYRGENISMGPYATFYSNPQESGIQDIGVRGSVKLGKRLSVNADVSPQRMTAGLRYGFKDGGSSRKLKKYQGTDASQTGTEEPIRTVMDPRYGQQSTPVLPSGLPNIQNLIQKPATQSAINQTIIQNPNWKEGDDEANKWITSIDLPTVEGETLYSFPTCVGGLCYDMASNLGQGIDEFKKRNNVIGDAWNIIDTAFGEKIDYNPNDFTNLKVGDVVSLTRDRRSTDVERGINTDVEQHMGRISKIVDGVPYVKHYMPGIEGKGKRDGTEYKYGRYLEEPINNISEVSKYTPGRIKRLPDYRELNYQPSTFGFDQNYKPNVIEKQMLEGMKEKPMLQKILALDNEEYNDLEKLTYGILFNEGGFGRSESSLYRMAVPDFVQKLVKQGYDVYRGTNNYDDNINNLSQGYGSIKESTLHGITQSDINADKSNKLSSEEINRRVKQGDYTNLEKTNNYLYEAMREMGLNTDNLENGANSFKAVIATLAWYKKRFPNATNDELIQKFLGKKNITKYKNNMENAYRNIDRNLDNNLQYSFLDQAYGVGSQAANAAYAGLKDARSKIVSAARDYSGMPLMLKGILGDVMGGKEPITNTTLSSSQMDALTEIVRNQVNSGKNYLDYNAYFPDLTRGQRLEVSGGIGDEGAGSSKMEKLARAMSPEGQLQNTFGQASIVPLGNNRYMVTDTYDFNDQGKSFGLLDDLRRRGPDPYSIARSIGRNYGSMDEQGAPVRIIIDLNEKKTGGITSDKAKEMLRDGSVHGHPLTDKQKRYFGWIAGGKKRDGGSLPMAQTGLPKVLTYANAPEYFDNRAVYSDNPQYNDIIRKFVYAGTHGFNPQTGELVKLDTPVSVPKDVRRMANQTGPSGAQESFNRNMQDPEFRKKLVETSTAEAYQNPLMYAPGSIGMAMLPPAWGSAYGFGLAGTQLAQGDYGTAGLTAGLSALPFVPSIVSGFSNQVMPRVLQSDIAKRLMSEEALRNRVVSNINLTNFQKYNPDRIGGGGYGQAYSLRKFPELVLKVSPSERARETFATTARFEDIPQYPNQIYPRYFKSAKDVLGHSHPEFEPTTALDYEVMSRIPGVSARKLTGQQMSEIPLEAYSELRDQVDFLRRNDVGIDFQGDNLMYDPGTKRFGLIDLSPEASKSAEWAKSNIFKQLSNTTPELEARGRIRDILLDRFKNQFGVKNRELRYNLANQEADLRMMANQRTVTPPKDAKVIYDLMMDQMKNSRSATVDPTSPQNRLLLVNSILNDPAWGHPLLNELDAQRMATFKNINTFKQKGGTLTQKQKEYFGWIFQ